MPESSRPRRPPIWALLLVLLVAPILFSLHSCDFGAPSEDEPSAKERADAAKAARPSNQPAPRPRQRRPAEETSESPAGDATNAAASAAAKEPAKTQLLRILRPDGSPAAGARIEMTRRALWIDSPPQSWMWRWRTADADGRADLEPGFIGVLLYVHLGSDAGWAHRAGKADPWPDVRLEPGFVVRGRTLDSNVVPVPAAQVHAEMFPPGAGGSIVVATNSNADGVFELPPLPFDDAGDGRESIEIVAYAQDLVPGSVKTTRAAASTGQVVVTLYRGGALRGRLVRADGNPAPSCRVLMAGTHVATLPDADGTFALRLPADGGAVFVYDGVKSALPRFSARSLGTFRGDAGDRDLGDIVVDGGKSVRGVVARPRMSTGKGTPAPVQGAGETVADVRVTVLLAGIELLSVTTDGNGAFEVPLSGDEHDLVVTQRSGDRITGTATLHGVRGGDPDVSIIFGAMGILVRLRDENGAKIEPAGVHLDAALHGRKSGVSYADLHSGSGSINGPRSEVRVQLPAEGVYDLLVIPEGGEFEPASYENVEVRADRDAEIEVRLKKKKPN